MQFQFLWKCCGTLNNHVGFWDFLHLQQTCNTPQWLSRAWWRQQEWHLQPPCSQTVTQPTLSVSYWSLIHIILWANWLRCPYGMEGSMEETSEFISLDTTYALQSFLFKAFYNRCERATGKRESTELMHLIKYCKVTVIVYHSSFCS